MGGGYWWLELSWCLDGHGSFHPNPSELRRLCSFEHEDVNSLCSLSSNALKALSRNKDIEKLERWNDFFCSEENMGGGYWWLELSWCLDGHGSFHPNPSELRRLCSFEHEDVNSLCSLSSNALKALSRNKDIEK
ncbi:hypothetical protein HID58_018281 [Brassica napus]|uniref:Uncharacterized protein n=1 Tax=Brassica napus TaxID=3708 RepID=A0ABQ8D9H4_BRANA|nr:hypothetical protein HID58_018281 [Brassica napus]